jgi:hypothetical protein
MEEGYGNIIKNELKSGKTNGNYLENIPETREKRAEKQVKARKA